MVECLAILRCPETGLKFREALGSEVQALNERLMGKKLKSRGGGPLPTQIEEALIRSDGRMVVAVVDGIPNMMIQDALIARQP